MQLTSQSLLRGTWFQAVAIGLIALLGLTACGGSGSSSSDYSYAYIQFYNASPNGANVEMREVDGDSFGSAQFGDTTSMYSMDDGELELEFIRTDSDDQEVFIDEITVNLKTGYKTIVVMSGDFSNPAFTPIKRARNNNRKHLEVIAVN